MNEYTYMSGQREVERQARLDRRKRNQERLALAAIIVGIFAASLWAWLTMPVAI